MKSNRLTEGFGFDFDDEDAVIDSIIQTGENNKYFYQMKDEVDKFLTFYSISNAEFTEEGINVDGDIDLSGLKLKKIPYKFNIVTGTFNVSFNDLRTLENSPRIVRNNFICSYNHLKSFEGAPDVIEGTFRGEKQKYGFNPNLSDKFYREWRKGLLEDKMFESKVKLLESGEFGDLLHINKNMNTCDVLLESGKVVYNIPTNKVDLISK